MESNFSKPTGKRLYDKITIGCQGITDTPRFADTKFRKRLGVPEDHVLAGTVAAIAGHKDDSNLLHASKDILQRTDNVSFCGVDNSLDETEVHAMA